MSQVDTDLLRLHLVQALHQLGQETYDALRDLRHDLIEASDLRDRAALVAWEQLLRQRVDSGLDIGMDTNPTQREVAQQAWLLASAFIEADCPDDVPFTGGHHVP